MSTRKGGDRNPDIGDILTPPKFLGPHSVALEYSLPSPLRMKQYRRWERTAQSELLSNIVPFGESPIVGLAFTFLNNGGEGGEDGEGGGDDVAVDSPPSSPVPLPLQHSQGQQPQRQREWGIFQVNEARDVFYQPFRMVTAGASKSVAPLFQPITPLTSAPYNTGPFLPSARTLNNTLTSQQPQHPETPDGIKAGVTQRPYKLVDFMKLFENIVGESKIKESGEEEEKKKNNNNKVVEEEGESDDDGDDESEEAEVLLMELYPDLVEFLGGGGVPKTLKEIQAFIRAEKQREVSLETLRGFLQERLQYEKLNNTINTNYHNNHNNEDEEGERVPKIVETHRIRDKGTRTRGVNSNPKTTTITRTTRTTVEAAGEDREPHIYYTLPLGLLSEFTDYHTLRDTSAAEEGESQRAGDMVSQGDPFSTPLGTPIPFMPPPYSQGDWGTPSSTSYFASQFGGLAFPLATPQHPTTNTAKSSSKKSEPFKRPPYLEGIKRLAPLWVERETAFFKKSFPGKRLSAIRANRGRVPVPPPPSVPRVARKRTEGIRIQGIVDNPGDSDDGIVRVSQSDPAWDLAQGRKKRKRQETPQDGGGDEEVNPPAFKIPRKPTDMPPRPSLAVTASTTTTTTTPASLDPVFLTPVVPASTSRRGEFDDVDNSATTTASQQQQQPTSPSSYLTPPVIVARAKNTSKPPPSRRRRTLGF